MINPALPDDDFARSVQIAQTAFEASRPAVVVGSSRGGAVALNIDSGSAPLVLIAPAWRRWGTAGVLKSRAIVLHSPGDLVIPIEDSHCLIQASTGVEPTLMIVGEDHNMIDARAFAALLEAIESAARFPT